MLVDPQILRPKNAIVERVPTTVFTVFVHASCNVVKIKTPYRFSDCLGAALVNFGRVCGAGFRVVSTNGNFRFWSLPNANMNPPGAAGQADYIDGWIAISQTMFNGNSRLATWEPSRLISIIQHEISHKPQFGNLGWQLHAPVGSKNCMEPNTPLLARYPKTEAGVDLYGLAGFSRIEANYLAVRYGTRWLYWTDER